MKANYRVLIVDDDPVNVDILEEMLEDKYTLASVETGEEALEILPKFRPDLMLLDIMMPGVDGYEVCRRIRADEQYNFIKIILVSVKAMVEERLEGYEVGADDYITKPFVDEELEAKVRVFLRLKRTEEVDRVKGDLLKLFSHETRTPLNGVMGYASLLQDEESLSDEAKDYVNEIVNAGNQLLHFVKKTSLLCRLKSGFDLNKRCESVVRHLEAAIEKLEGKASRNNITFELDTKNDVNLGADWSILYDVLVYVLENAVKFSPAGGIVKVQLEETDGSCLIRIVDQGGGIEPEWIDKIFDEFAIQDIMHHQKGQGLSLAISRHVMDLHGGLIQVESTPGNGATFTLSLPVEAFARGCLTF